MKSSKNEAVNKYGIMQFPQIWKLHNYLISYKIIFHMATMAYFRHFHVRSIIKYGIMQFPQKKKARFTNGNQQTFFSRIFK